MARNRPCFSCSFNLLPHCLAPEETHRLTHCTTQADAMVQVKGGREADRQTHGHQKADGRVLVAWAVTGDTQTDPQSHARVRCCDVRSCFSSPLLQLRSMPVHVAAASLSLNPSHQLSCRCISRAPMSHTEDDRCPISPMNALLTPCLRPRLRLCCCSSSPSPCNLHHINRTRIRFFFIHFYQQLCVCAGSQKGGACRRQSSTTSSTTTSTIRTPIPRLMQRQQSLAESDKSRSWGGGRRWSASEQGVNEPDSQHTHSLRHASS